MEYKFTERLSRSGLALGLTTLVVLLLRHQAQFNPLQRARISSRMPSCLPGMEDIDLATMREYKDDIQRAMKETEAHTTPRRSTALPAHNWPARKKLLEFLVDLHQALELQPATLFLAINLFDRYNSKVDVARNYYQLIGCTALLVAAKYLQRREQVPTMSELEKACLGQYKQGEFAQMEWNMLIALDWQVGHPDVYAFIRLMLLREDESRDAAQGLLDFELESLTLYIAEIAALHGRYMCTMPSAIADSALSLARAMLQIRTRFVVLMDIQLYNELWFHLCQPPAVLERKHSRVSSVVRRVVQKQEHFAREQQKWTLTVQLGRRRPAPSDTTPQPKPHRQWHANMIQPGPEQFTSVIKFDRPHAPKTTLTPRQPCLPVSQKNGFAWSFD